MERDQNTEYVLSLSYGKDSVATLEAIRILGYPLDRIVHAEVWATDSIPADVPAMIEFKEKADKIIKEKYGITVEHICAMKNGGRLTFEKCFYHMPKRRNQKKTKYKDFRYGEFRIADQCSSFLPYKGWPLATRPWCRKLKIDYAISPLWGGERLIL